MPLVCAAQWIATKGGQTDFDPSDTGPWRSAFQELLDRVASSEVHISGIHENVRESIDGVVFAGCQVDYPYCDATAGLCWSEIYYIQSYPYLDDEHWRRGFDDSFRNRDKVRWKQLMVARADVAMFWPFAMDGPPKSGAAGRPTSMHLVCAEFGERVGRGDLETTLSKQAEVLVKWLVRTYPAHPPAGRKAIESGIRHAFWAAKKA